MVLQYPALSFKPGIMVGVNIAMWLPLRPF
jgi:hypothetical protein